MHMIGPRYQISGNTAAPHPAVYICRHLNMRGPIITLGLLPIQPRPWILAKLCQKQSCFAHYCDYTFTQRFGWPRFLAKLIAYPLAIFMDRLTTDLEAIPVHRDKQSFRTISQSVQALLEGDDLILYPDVEYRETGDIGQLYQGFLLVEKFYYRKSNNHLPFIPIKLHDHQLLIGAPLYFETYQDDQEFQRQSQILAAQISAAI
ncbi:MAG: hypothetical protein RR387_00210 [Clostridiales bacterium]